MAAFWKAQAFTTGTISGKIKEIQVRSSLYGADYSTYVRFQIGTNPVISFAIPPSESMRTQLLSAAQAAKAADAVVTLDYSVESCAYHSPDNYCNIIGISY
jgi:hypothetical protein